MSNLIQRLIDWAYRPPWKGRPVEQKLCYCLWRTFENLPPQYRFIDVWFEDGDMSWVCECVWDGKIIIPLEERWDGQPMVWRLLPEVPSREMLEKAKAFLVEVAGR